MRGDVVVPGKVVDLARAIDQEAWADMGQALTCHETEALCALLDALTLHQQSELVMAGHAAADGPEDRHYQEEVR